MFAYLSSKLLIVHYWEAKEQGCCLDQKCLRAVSARQSCASFLKEALGGGGANSAVLHCLSEPCAIFGILNICP